MLTLARQTPSIDRSANNHNIIDDSETTFDAGPLAFLVSHPAVESLGEGQFIFAEELPAGAVDDFIRGPA
jgi:hypothetical protein